MRNELMQQQQEGNDIIIFPTPATTMNTRTTSSSLATDDEYPEEHAEATVRLEKNKTIATAESNNSKQATRKWKFGHKLSAYFHHLFSHFFKSGVMGNNANNTTITNNMHDIGNTNAVKNRLSSGCFPSTTWRDLKFKRGRYRLSRTMKKRHKQKFLWCFRPVGTAAAFQFSTSSWTEFEKKNQLELSRQLNLLSNGLSTQASFEVQDKHIFDGSMVMTVMLKEGMAFVLDPEWSMPITYEITFKPKLSWYQEIRMRLEYQKWIKEQQRRQRSS